MSKIAVFGAGTWGTALAVLLSDNGNDVTIWSAIPAEIEARRRQYEYYRDKLLSFREKVA